MRIGCVINLEKILLPKPTTTIPTKSPARNLADFFSFLRGGAAGEAAFDEFSVSDKRGRESSAWSSSAATRDFMPEYDALLQACLQLFVWGVIERANSCTSHIVLVQVLRRRRRAVSCALQNVCAMLTLEPFWSLVGGGGRP